MPLRHWGSHRIGHDRSASGDPEQKANCKTQCKTHDPQEGSKALKCSEGGGWGTRIVPSTEILEQCQSLPSHPTGVLARLLAAVISSRFGSSHKELRGMDLWVTQP